MQFGSPAVFYLWLTTLLEFWKLSQRAENGQADFSGRGLRSVGKGIGICRGGGEKGENAAAEFLGLEAHRGGVESAGDDPNLFGAAAAA
jgi:hypothetical protein